MRSLLLLPLAWMYQLALCVRRVFSSPVSVPVPVICVGNVTVGGAGKTPVVLALAEQLRAENKRVFCISKGYGGKAVGAPMLVDPAIHTAADVGDEALLLARYVPTVVARSRLLAARFAVDRGAEILVLDDGFQDRQLAITKGFLVVDSAYGFGNGCTVPAGPLREPLARALKRAHGIIVMGDQPIPLELAGVSCPITRGRVVALSSPSPEKRYVAFAGIAHPEKFFATLLAQEAAVVSTRRFPDHYAYTAEDLHALFKEARAKSAFLITTEKDAMRIPTPLDQCVEVLKIAVTFDSPVTL